MSPGSGGREAPPAEGSAVAEHPPLRRAHGWPRWLRLRRGADIRPVQRRGRRVRRRTMTVVVHPNDLGHPRFGMAVSRRVGNAVVRHRVKRWLREVFRHTWREVDAVDVLILARPEAAEAGLEGLRADVIGALRKAGVWRS